MAVQEHHAQNVIMNSLLGFKKMMKTKYGSLFSAFRNILDVDHNGIVTQLDFAQACRVLGVKSVQKLWSELDVNRNGQITLKELDPDVGDSFKALEAGLVEQFGSTELGWKKVFDIENTLRCDQDKFAAGCAALGIPSEPLTPEQFFKRLRPEPGLPYLAYDDLWSRGKIVKGEPHKR